MLAGVLPGIWRRLLVYRRAATSRRSRLIHRSRRAGTDAVLQLSGHLDEQRRDDDQRQAVRQHEYCPDVLLHVVFEATVADAKAVECGVKNFAEVDVANVDGVGEDGADWYHPHPDYTKTW